MDQIGNLLLSLIDVYTYMAYLVSGVLRLRTTESDTEEYEELFTLFCIDLSTLLNVNTVSSSKFLALYGGNSVTYFQMVE